MANPQHYAHLVEGLKHWEEWRKENQSVAIDLSEIKFSPGAKLTRIDFSYVNLSNADLRGCSFLSSNFSHANLSNATLAECSFVNANLTRSNFSNTNCQRANFREADLTETNLTRACLLNASLMEANLSQADLRDANLARVLAIRTNFTRANLTGACVADWRIDSTTVLSSLKCDYVYFKWRGNFDIDYLERCPADPDDFFKPGDFQILVQKSLFTVDLIFRRGVDWQALLISLEKLKIEAEGIELSVQAIENKSDGAFVVRVNVPQEANKAEIEKFLKREYEVALKAIDEKYQFQLQLQNERLDEYHQEVQERRQANTSLLRLVETMAENQGSKYDMRGSTFGNFADVVQSGGKQQTVQHIYAAEQKQNLAEAAAEIQKLLKQLEDTNPSATEAEKIAYVNDETTPSFKHRVVSTLQSSGEAAIDEFILDNKYLKVAKAAVKGWLQPDG